MAVPFSEAARRTLQSLTDRPPAPGSVSAVIGLDGFVDELVSVVDTRVDADTFRPIETISRFADRIAAAAGLSTNFELVTRQIKLGGNAPIMSLAMARQGAKVTCVGALGEDDIHPAFQELAAEARVISLTAPGYTHALEFDDGKLMFGKVQSLNAVTWERLLERVAEPGLAPMYEDADVIGFVNWTMLPYATDIWRRFAAEVLPRLTRRPIAFFDLADPHKRSKEDLREALQVLETFQAHCAVYLGLNRKEAAEVAAALGIEGAADATVELEAATRGIGEVLDIEGVVVHPTERAGAYVRGEYVEVAGPYTPKPKLTTGAGDNFNAGLCLGLALGFTLQEALTLGAATSGYYVRHGGSPTLEQLRDFLTKFSA